MKKQRISVVIITNKENEMEGIVTKTDLVSIFLTKSSKQYKVSEIMKKQVISDREVQEYKWKKGLEEIHSNEISYLFPFQASDIMSENPITVEHDSEIKKAITLMIKCNISGLPLIPFIVFFMIDSKLDSFAFLYSTVSVMVAFF